MNTSTLRALSRHLVRQLGMLDKQCGDIELSPIQAHCLIELEQHPLTVNQIADNLSVDKSNASRTLTKLANLDYVFRAPNTEDKRSVLYALTSEGKRLLQRLNRQQDVHYQGVLSRMSLEEQAILQQALDIYNRSLAVPTVTYELRLRLIQKSDNADLATVIRSVSEEHGISNAKGYSAADPTLDCLYEVYAQPRSQYWVIEHNGKIMGGGGYAPLSGKEEVCELQKMYFLPEVRGKGLAKTLANLAMSHAKKNGFEQCYLETTECLKTAVKLYEKLGFQYLDAPWGNTGHNACEIVMAKSL